MRFRIVRNVPAATVTARVQPAFRDLLPPALSQQERVTLILFRFQREKSGSGVVMGNVVEQALDRLGERNDERFQGAEGHRAGIRRLRC